ncbi:DUF4871 domain-containing protein [Cytobacillus sp. Sa5YUA1]|uniref:DUF4871 domain-containing protein n=1 Tax=Cytobacillus stercorigallinarum TaxID=2762240 RepID=A0ABR8QST7_9BACI|nr:DUF4871 domain-containing protein [Cytobacillus stercorigallinarum]MBD7938332.1 DUF4871 domain-containing protein [Cytobacillus stercorigallinarum]
MEKELKQLRETMDSSMLKGEHFTTTQKLKIKEKIKSEYQPKKRVKSKFPLYIATIATTFFIIFVLAKQPISIKMVNMMIDGDIWDIRHTFSINSRELFSVFPDPNLTVNGEYSYLFSFKEPFEKYEGKDLAIYAINKRNGERITILPSKIITQASSGYESLNRFTTVFALPEPGIWKLEIQFDNQYYGDVVLSVPDDNLPLFVTKDEIRKIDWNQKAIRFKENMIGNENKTGIIGADLPSVEHNQKWMWHLWGIKNPTETELTVVGYHKGSKTTHQILTTGWSIDLSSSNNEADAHAPSSVKLPKTGQWAILIYTNEKLFDTIILNIK